MENDEKAKVQAVQRVTFNSKEAAEYLGISYWLMLEMVKRGELNPIRAGGRYLFRQSGLDAWMTKQEEGEVSKEKTEVKSLTIVKTNRG